jgi:predicted O-methyltransferase YrrM
MSQDLWNAVDQYFVDHLHMDDPLMDAALAHSEASGLPAIHVAPNQGKMLMLLAQMRGAQRILEIGTLGGYSTIWLARGLRDGGQVLSLEVDAYNAQVARENIARAGMAERVEVRVGAALTTLPTLTPLAPFDMVFIDADKDNNAAYFEWALKLTQRGSLIIVDNVVRDGKVIDAQDTDGRVQGTRRLFERVAREPRVQATALQTVGSKGYDGLIMALVVDEG